MKTHLIQRAALSLLLVTLSGPLYAGSWFAPDPAPSTQVEPLILSVRTVWDQDITTVGQAAMWVLGSTGYRLKTDYPAPEWSEKVAEKPIPPTMTIKRTMPIIDALQLLIGTDNTVIVDRRNKLISFEQGAR